MFRVKARTLVDDLAVPEVQAGKDQNLPDLIGIARLENLAARDQAAESLGFLIDAVLDQAARDLSARKWLLFLEEDVEQELDVLVREREVFSPVSFGFGLIGQQRIPLHAITHTTSHRYDMTHWRLPGGPQTTIISEHGLSRKVTVRAAAEVACRIAGELV